MSLLSQKTLKKTATFSGVGLHNGKLARVLVKPSEPNTGIVFKRVDLKSNNYIYPSFTNVTNTLLNTTISNEHGVKVSTIEHLMGALFGLGIDNALIEINNDEVPILDGSAKEFIEILKDCGLEKSEAPIKIIKIQKKITFHQGEKFISIEPSKLSLDINFELKFEDCLIRDQKNKVNVYEDDLVDIFNSRTFCLFDDIEKIKGKGLAKGGSLDNAIVVKGNEILNSEKLRNPKEFVNHKILDCIGDLYTSGYRIVGSVNCSQGGHFLTNQLLKKVFENKDNFSIIEIQERNLPHTILNKTLLRSIA
ncbi:UDP-3-O-acyl-N-acetylglucosamine deacetylase [Candidatus Pelagibacter sp.]|uniref:UDP-3-O-acyl-N-acetylglucosamine deacetylase n=1 Tax=Candidatus Pelagibacter sp. TaxID=2024849 RepID=UPI003F85FD6F